MGFGIIGLAGFLVCKLLDEKDEWKLLHAETVRVRNAFNQDEIINAGKGLAEIVRNETEDREKQRQDIESKVDETKEKVDHFNVSWMQYLVGAENREIGINVAEELANAKTKIEDNRASLNGAR